VSVLSPLVATASPGVAAACVAASYLLGTFPSAWLATRRRGVDPTSAGSGNPGATNVYRTAGRGAGVLTLVGDVFKGAGAAALGWAVGGHGLGVACGVAAVVGHVAPLVPGPGHTSRFHGRSGHTSRFRGRSGHTSRFHGRSGHTSRFRGCSGHTSRFHGRSGHTSRFHGRSGHTSRFHGRSGHTSRFHGRSGRGSGRRVLRGGKGVATVAGMALVLFPLAALVSAAAFGVVTTLSRTVSLGSIAAVAVLPAAAGALGAPGREVAALAGCAVIVIARHRANIRRLWRGEEPHLGTAA
jgi:glycerol-3-phosphate acyltransferase PlsY